MYCKEDKDFIRFVIFYGCTKTKTTGGRTLLKEKGSSSTEEDFWKGLSWGDSIDEEGETRVHEIPDNFKIVLNSITETDKNTKERICHSNKQVCKQITNNSQMIQGPLLDPRFLCYDSF